MCVKHLFVRFGWLVGFYLFGEVLWVLVGWFGLVFTAFAMCQGRRHSSSLFPDEVMKCCKVWRASLPCCFYMLEMVAIMPKSNSAGTCVLVEWNVL